MILGITGGSGCGKTTLLSLLATKGAVILDCDAIYHELLENDRNMLSSIAAQFPAAFVDGKLDRKKLGQLVFAEEAALQTLNAITHNGVKQAVLEKLQENPKLAVIDAIALHESGLAQLCDVTVAVTATEENRINRLVARDGISYEYALLRIRAQKNNEAFSQMCDYILDNNGTTQEFTDKCLAFFRELGII